MHFVDIEKATAKVAFSLEASLGGFSISAADRHP